jgi:hypothetical protein
MVKRFTPRKNTKSLPRAMSDGTIGDCSFGFALAQLRGEKVTPRRCTLLAARIFKATGAAGLSDDLPFGGIFADLMAGRQHISNQYEYVGSSWGGVMFGLENKDLML